MITGRSPQFKGPAIVAFVDILGFSNEVMSNWNNVQNDPLQKLLEIRKLAEQSSLHPLHTIGVEGKILIEGGVSIVSLSDSFVLLHGIELVQSEIKYINFINGLFSACAAIRSIWSKSMELGFTVRGAITLNEIYWDSDATIVGPGLIEAYGLESKQAKTSRIIISSRINQMLRDFSRNIPDSMFQSHIIERFAKDQDDWIIINPKYALGHLTDPISTVNRMVESLHEPMLRSKYSSLQFNLARDERIKISDFGNY